MNVHGHLALHLRACAGNLVTDEVRRGYIILYLIEKSLTSLSNKYVTYLPNVRNREDVLYIVYVWHCPLHDVCTGSGKRHAETT